MAEHIGRLPESRRRIRREGTLTRKAEAAGAREGKGLAGASDSPWVRLLDDLREPLKIPSLSHD